MPHPLTITLASGVVVTIPRSQAPVPVPRAKVTVTRSGSVTVGGEDFAPEDFALPVILDRPWTLPVVSARLEPGALKLPVTGGFPVVSSISHDAAGGATDDVPLWVPFMASPGKWTGLSRNTIPVRSKADPSALPVRFRVLKNLTGFPLPLQTSAGKVVLPSEGRVTIKTTFVKTSEVETKDGAVPLGRTEVNGVEGLPDREDGVGLVVSTQVLGQFPDRTDLLTPFGTDEYPIERDEKGQPSLYRVLAYDLEHALRTA